MIAIVPVRSINKESVSFHPDLSLRHIRKCSRLTMGMSAIHDLKRLSTGYAASLSKF
jgi:hypothetical protein